MEFSNPEIDVSTLPGIEEIEWKPIERNYLKVLRLEWLITMIVLLIISIAVLIFISSLRELPWIVIIGGGWLFIVGFYFFIQEKSFWYRSYAIREKDVLYRHGWIVREVTACPFNRIQNCTVSSGPFERKYDLATISMYTAGSDGADLKIAGLPETTAVRLREFVMQKIATDEQAIL